MEQEKETAPPPMTGKPNDIPIPSLGTPEPSGPIPPPPFSGEVSDTPRARSRRGKRTTTATPEPEPIPGQSELSPEQQAAADEALAAALGNAFRVVFSIAAAVRGEHWNINDNDAKLLGTSGAAALGPYMGAAAKWMPLALFGLNVAGVALPRLQRDAQLAKELEASEPPKATPIAVLP